MPAPPYVWTPEADAILRARCAEGWGLGRIAEELAATYEQVKQRRRRLGLTPPSKRGQSIDWAKAREMYAAGNTDKEIAAALGIGQSTIKNWRRDNGLHTKQAKEGFIVATQRSKELASVPWPTVCHHGRALFASTFGKKMWEDSPEARRDTGGPMPSRQIAGWHSSSLTRTG